MKLSFGDFGCRFDGYKTSGIAFVDELDHAGDLGEKSIVLAPANVGARLNRCATLPHNDGATMHKLSAKCLYAEALRIGVTAVS